jgi:acyl-CoA thioester hydrolase
MIAHVHRIRVYYEDTDAGGVVYHARYLAFAERARTETLREAGLSHADMGAEHGVMFMVRRADLEYLRPARLDDLLTIRTETIGATGATVTLRQSFYRNAETGQEEMPIVVARIQLVCVKMATGGPARIPVRWRAALAGSMGDA